MKSNSELRVIMKSILSASRFQHSLCVARLAKKIAPIYDWDPKKAEQAGILHDCAKEWSARKLANYVLRWKIPVPDFDFIRAYAPNVFHGYVGAHYAEKKGWTKDPLVLKAISSHTLGSMPIGKESQILYVADLASPDRRYQEAKRIRQTAMKNLRKAFIQAMRVKLSYAIRKNKPVHPLSIRLWNRVHG